MPLFQHYMIMRRGCHQDPIPFPEFSVRKFSFPGTETCFSELCLLPLIQSVVGGWGLQEWIQGDKRGWQLSFSESLLSPRCCALCFTHIISNPPTMSHSNLRLMPMHSLPPLPVVSVPVETSWDLFSYGNIPLALCSFIQHIFTGHLLCGKLVPDTGDTTLSRLAFQDSRTATFCQQGKPSI